MAPRRPVWLLEVKDRGGPRRYASRAVTVGGKVYQPGLAHFTLDVNEALSEHGVEVTDVTVTDWRPRSGDEASLTFYDESTGDVRRVLDGIVVSPEWSDPSRPHTVMFSVAARVRTTTLYPPSSERVTADTFDGPADAEAVTSGFDDAIAGATYPTIIGYPGMLSEGANALVCMPLLHTVALDYNDTNLLVARGRIDATSLQVFDLDTVKQVLVGYTAKVYDFTIATATFGATYEVSVNNTTISFVAAGATVQQIAAELQDAIDAEPLAAYLVSTSLVTKTASNDTVRLSGRIAGLDYEASESDAKITEEEVVGVAEVLADTDPTQLVSKVLPVQVAKDKLGQEFSYLSFDVPSVAYWEDLRSFLGNRYATGFTSKAGRGGGMVGPGGSVLRGLGDVIVWMLTTGGVQVDTQRQLGHLADLNSSKVDAILNVPDMDLPRLVDSQLVELFSLLRVQTAKGVYYRRKVTDPQARHAVAHLSTARHEAIRSSSVQGLYRQPETSFALEYAHNLVRESHIRSVRAVPFAELDGDVVVESLRRTLTRYGPNAGRTMQTSLIWDETTAKRCVADMALIRGRQWLATTYELARLRGLEFGDVVTITDPAANLQAQPAVVTNITLGGVLPVVTLTWPEAA